MKNIPRVGVALIVRKGNSVLLHKRKGKHAPGTYAFPGGHLEMWEAFEECALRELREEAGKKIKVKDVNFFTITNDMFFDEGKHSITIILNSDWVSGEPKITEPEKCESWGWYDWNDLPQPLMQGIQNIIKSGLNPFTVI